MSYEVTEFVDITIKRKKQLRRSLLSWTSQYCPCPLHTWTVACLLAAAWWYSHLSEFGPKIMFDAN